MNMLYVKCEILFIKNLAIYGYTTYFCSDSPEFNFAFDIFRQRL